MHILGLGIPADCGLTVVVGHNILCMVGSSGAGHCSLLWPGAGLVLVRVDGCYQVVSLARSSAVGCMPSRHGLSLAVPRLPLQP